MVTKADPPAGDPPAGDPPEGDEAKFWQKLSDTLDARIDAGIDRAIEKRTGPGNRTGRSTFPQMLNDLLFGAPAAKKE